ncbi:hypothetical protein CsSME_00032716 [Camellia sinensis var. sinensis]
MAQNTIFTLLAWVEESRFESFRCQDVTREAIIALVSAMFRNLLMVSYVSSMALKWFDSFSKEYKVLHIFGTRHGMNTARFTKSSGKEVLVPFNVASEKFHLIPLPEGNMPSKPNLTQIRGGLALFGYEDCGYNSIGLWVLEDYHRLLWIKNNINVASSQNHKRVKVVLVGSNYVGDMLLTQSMFTHHYDLIPCCHENRTASTRMIRIRGLPPWIDLYGAKNINFRIANHVESLVPLGPLDMQFGDFVVHDA